MKSPIGILVLALNIPFLFLEKILLGKMFAVQSLLTFLLKAASMNLFLFDAVTSNPRLIAFFGCCLIAIGKGLCIRSGSTADAL